MATLVSAGIGSGLDVSAIVTQLMKASQGPMNALTTKQTAYQAQLSAYGTISSGLSQFRTALSALTDPAKLATVTAKPVDDTVLSATGGVGAVPGNYSVEVRKLAQAQTLVGAGQTNASAVVGSGTLTFDFGTTSTSNGTTSFTPNGLGGKTLTIDSSNNTLTGIRDAINAAGMGVTATIVNDGSNQPYRLTLSSSSTGEANSMRIGVSGDATLSSLLAYDPAGTKSMEQTSEAQSAELTVNGVLVKKASNSVSDVVPGVTLNLKKTNLGSPTSLAVAYDTEAVTKAVTGFVDAYNKIDKSLQDLSKYDPATKKAGALHGDSTIRVMRSQLRGIISAQLTGGASSFTLLNQIGVETQTDGTLALNTKVNSSTGKTKLQTAIETNFSQLSSLFAANGSSSDSQIRYTGSTSGTLAGNYAVDVSQLATQGSLVGQGAAGLTIAAGSNDTLNVTLDNINASITLTPGSYASAAALAAEIQTRINGTTAFTSVGSAVSVSADSNGVLSLTSSRYSASSSVNLAGNAASTVLGGSGTATQGTALMGTINGVAAIGSGQTLTAATGDAAAGLKITVSGGTTGPRGNINFSRGFAAQLDQLAADFLGNNGSLTARTEGINSSLKRLSSAQLREQMHLDTLQAQYQKQFNALDSLMSKMNSTANYLTQQLAALG
ncbi:flagellar filament capping protein FliD [Malikia sp.]|uniref:flagellar filament capping protein FliD n=1 Tax=Malikia sp. TaxID=2070706 RepID=UPI002619D9F2|nr:flagellar filament capping protein FliD [Malikia sp.]MDD2727889.1 flagellar filament capping protein FliD [Malikia sp.]